MTAMNDMQEFVDVEPPRFLKLKPSRTPSQRLMKPRQLKRRETCARCGKPIVGRRPGAKYCSDRCLHRHDYELRRKEQGKPIDYDAERTCDWCGKPLVGKRIDARFCDKYCYMKDYNANKRKKGA